MCLNEHAAAPPQKLDEDAQAPQRFTAHILSRKNTFFLLQGALFSLCVVLFRL